MESQAQINELADYYCFLFMFRLSRDNWHLLEISLTENWTLVFAYHLFANLRDFSKNDLL